MEKPNEEEMRSIAAGFLITSEIIKTKIGDLSEGQKGLVAFARLVLERHGFTYKDVTEDVVDEKIKEITKDPSHFAFLPLKEPSILLGQLRQLFYSVDPKYFFLL
jgi:hypothetical protein